MATGPVSTYDNMAQDIFSSLIMATDPEYHLKMADLVLDAMDAIYIEKKFGRAEDFKTKIVYKMAHLISILV